MSINAASALQHQASNPAQHVWVSASAGSGKTTVLVNRLLRLLIGDGLPAPALPHRILCLTYTKAAAQEMQLRLDARLMHWATTEAKNLDADLQILTGQQPDESMRARARSLFAELSDTTQSLRIQTIHSFCQSVLARFPVEAGISPGFTALDEVEANGLLQQALDNVWQQPGGAPWQKSKAWLESRYSSATQLQNIVPGLLRNWSEMTAVIPDDNAEEFYWQNSFTALDTPETENELWTELFSDKNLPLAALRAWAAKNKKQGTAMFDFIAADVEARISTREFYWDLFFTQKDEPRKGLPEDLLDEPARLLRIKDQRLAAASAAMGILLARAGREYQCIKTQQGALDFADMISRTRALLTQSEMGAWVHYKLDGGIDHILLDEAQDTAPDQWQVIHALATEFFTGLGAADRPRSLFVVGDPKQSIYSFQGADSSLFRAVEMDLSARAAAANTKLDIVPLSYSFRTAPNLLTWVDKSFSGADKTLALHGYAETIRHNAIHENRVGAARIYPPVPEIRNKKDHALLADANDGDNTHNARLAAQIAATVSSWLRAGRVIAGGNQAVQPRDILILLQQRTTLADELQFALTSAGVPVMGSDRLALADAPAVQDMFALCQFLLFPQDDLNLAIALRSPFINLSENYLEKISSMRSERSLWQALNANSEFEKISNYLRELLNSTDHDTVYETLARMLFLPCPAAASGLTALHARLGTPVDDPVHELLQLAQHEGEAHHPLSLGAFMDWIKKSNIKIKRDMAQQNQNVVRILTVHGAKGLEAPIVLLADASDLPHAHGSKQDKAVKYESGVPYFLFAPGKPEEGPAFDRSENRRAKADEHQRLLYVAMTRASHELHVFGKSNTKDEVNPNSWYAQTLKALQDLGANTNDHGVVCYGAADAFAQPTIITAAEIPAPPAIHVITDGPNIQQPIAITKYVQQHTRTQSYAANANPAAAQRGTVIHRLLELLPEHPENAQAEKAQRFLRRELPALSDGERLQITQQVLKIITAPETKMFFSHAARAEVPVAGHFRGTPVYGKIDRIFITETEIGILDFKTGEPPPGHPIPANYRQQIEIYSDLIGQIYPGRPIRAGILWTNNAKLLWLPSSDKAKIAAA